MPMENNSNNKVYLEITLLYLGQDDVNRYHADELHDNRDERSYNGYDDNDHISDFPDAPKRDLTHTHTPSHPSRPVDTRPHR